MKKTLRHWLIIILIALIISTIAACLGLRCGIRTKNQHNSMEK